MTTNSSSKPARPGAAAGRRRWAALLAGSLAGAAALLAAGVATPARAADLRGSFSGNAYGTSANVEAGAVATELGRSAFQPCPCRGTDGEVLTNRVDSLRAGEGGDVLRADATVATVRADKTATAATIQDTATITGLDALGGLITADSVKAVANVSATATTIATNPNGSTFVNLRVNGQRIAANVAPNTVIDLPGLGKVTLKKVRRSGDLQASGRILVEMITVDVTRANNLGLDVGAQVIVAHAVAAFSRTQPSAVVAGQAYATLANAAVGNDLQNRIGKAAFISIGCEGTDGETLTNNVETLDVGAALSLGSGVTTAFGGPRNGGTVARTTATVEDVSLLGGLITAGAIKAVAQETFKGGTRTRSTAGSGFVALRIAGASIPLNTPPNTRVQLPGFGRVIVNEQIEPGPAGRLQVNGLHIFVTRDNRLGLPVGSEIIVAHADAAASRF